MATADTSGQSSFMRLRPESGGWITQGMIGGVLAGIVFALFEMIMAALMNGASAFWMPLRMIGAIVLGQRALMPDYSLVGAAITGLIVHMVLAVIFGTIFAAIVAFVSSLATSHGIVIAAATIYGFVLWIVNFYAIARIARWDWFPDKTNPIVQFFAHALFFGTTLGLYLTATGHRTRRAA